MTIQKQCADHLRAEYRALTGEKLSSGHAHELIAAFFGYPTAAALQAEANYLLDDLPQASVLIPDLRMMDERRAQLTGLAGGLPDNDVLVAWIVESLTASEDLSAEIWETRDLAEYLDTDFLQKNVGEIEDELSAEIAITNAYFDELYVDDVAIQATEDALIATATGSLNGESDQERPFNGDKINFTIIITLDRVAGRTGYSQPEMTISGGVDESWYDIEE